MLNCEVENYGVFLFELEIRLLKEFKDTLAEGSQSNFSSS